MTQPTTGTPALHVGASSTATLPPAVEISALHLSYGPVTALEDIAFRVAPGEFMALLGPSGCGKTSLLRSIAGYVIPQRGAIRIHGRNVIELPPRRRNIGMVFQSYALFPHMTAADNVAFGLRCRGTPGAELRTAVGQMLQVVGLAGMADRKPGQLSGGQQQRVALARALVVRPDLLLLDEALSALDKALRVQMQTELKELQRRFGLATIFVTHDQEEAMAMADRIAVMRNGRIEQLDTPPKLFHAPATPWVAEFIGAGNLLRGPVQRGADGIARLALAAGLDCPVPDALVAGREAVGFVRTDRLSLEPAADGEVGLAVVGRRFLGGRVEILLRHEGTELRALLASDTADDFVPGARARARVALEDFRVFPSSVPA